MVTESQRLSRVASKTRTSHAKNILSSNFKKTHQYRTIKAKRKKNSAGRGAKN